ncbi:bifunctional 2-polyprenyl-6-hydroxyphenol methylase/3-demethylubiquinol 3-O-methyltransferase UbiG [Sutcliffiella horikoshii]|uniref:class I SAM-dependent methyltransferase n=1 Tax=Sutcliffiella horikoshii TaxID=79883 RepID=UPI001CBB63DE|nr:class I SAM-dependent methyltransferase [Sutcliffiella horikoshii]UAL45682.1 class I SAM-dependent methyltransferase [Sutcliffiella horikoshii]
MKKFNWNEETEKVWNERADFWHENSENMWLNGSRKTIIPFIKERLRQEAHVLDAGCGDGFGSFLLAESGYHVTGVDIAEAMIERAVQKRVHTNINFQKGSLTELPLENDSMDAVMAINSIEWVEQPLQVLEEFHKVLKPGGKLFLGLLGPTAGPRAHSYQRLYGKEAICNTMMPWEFERLALEEGWELLDGMPVYKEEAKKLDTTNLPRFLKQALTFMWVFEFQKK